LKLDINGKLTWLKLYDKRDDFNFSIVNFPYLRSNIPSSSAYGVYIFAADSLQWSSLPIQYNFPWGKCCLMRFIPNIKPFLVHCSYLCFVPLPKLELGLMVGVTGRQGFLTPPRQLIPPLVYSEVRVCPFL
jgi:hypothetical protein